MVLVVWCRKFGWQVFGWSMAHSDHGSLKTIGDHRQVVGEYRPIDGSLTSNLTSKLYRGRYTKRLRDFLETLRRDTIHRGYRKPAGLPAGIQTGTSFP